MKMPWWFPVVSFAIVGVAIAQRPAPRATPPSLRDAAPHVLGYCTLLVDGRMLRWEENRDGWCELRDAIDLWPQDVKPMLKRVSE